MPLRRQLAAPRPGGSELWLNKIGRVQLQNTVPLLGWPYSKTRSTGSFILVDVATGVTVGMINSGS